MNKKTKAKRSKIWTMTLEDFEKLVKKSSSISDILRSFGFAVTGRTFSSVKERIKHENIDASHIPLGKSSRLGRNFNLPKIALEKVLVRGSTYCRKSLKRRLIGDKLLENCCEICGQKPEWKNENLIMILDHTNGVRDDNRLENLRLLCPNCNSQQSTFAGRNNKK